MIGCNTNGFWSVIANQPNPGTHFDEGFQSLCSGIEQVPVRDDSPALGQQNHRRPAKMKIPLFLTFLHRPGLVSLNNAANGQRPHLNLKHASEFRARYHADHSFVSKARRAGSQCNRVYRVQAASETPRTGDLAIGREMKTVIIRGCQANNVHGARIESIQASDKLININRTAFDDESAIRYCIEGQYPALGGCDQVVWVSIDWSRLRLQLSREECVHGRISGGRELRLRIVDLVAMNEASYFAPAYPRSFLQTAEAAKPISLNKAVEKCSAPPCLVETTEPALAIHPLSSQFPGFPVDISNQLARRSHMLISPASGNHDRLIDGDAEYTIASVDPSSSEFHDFANFPHENSLNTLAPPAADVTRQLGPDSLFYRHGEARLFACYKNKQMIGRVVASVDQDFPDADVGHFGYFEACPDKTCARMLMQASEAWLKEKGKRRIEGPINLNMLAGYRFQTAGFDSRAFPGEPRNPEYYPNLIRSCGYREVARWQSWDISPLALRFLRAVNWMQRSKRRATRDRGYRIEVLRVDCLEEETRKIHHLVHEIFADNYGFSAVDFREHIAMQGGSMDGSAKVAGAFLYHSTQRKPVGFSYGFYMGQTAVFHTFGVTKEHRGTGGADLLFSAALKEIRSQGVSRAIGALAKEGKSKYERVGKPRRAYAVVGREL